MTISIDKRLALATLIASVFACLAVGGYTGAITMVGQTADGETTTQEVAPQTVDRDHTSPAPVTVTAPEATEDPAPAPSETPAPGCYQ